MEKGLPKRKPTRLKTFDYNAAGTYFLTICTEKRRNILSRIVGGDVLDAPKCVELLPHGRVADNILNQMGNFYPNLQIGGYVIMPNHIHLVLHIWDCEARKSSSARQHMAISGFVSTFKRFCNKSYGENIWQRHFYDHIIKGQKDYEAHLLYLHRNPARWFYDKLYTED